MLPPAAPAADIAIVDGSISTAAGDPARYHLTILHDGARAPVVLVIFGDGSSRFVRTFAHRSEGVYESDVVHAYPRAGRFVITIRSDSGQRLATRPIFVKEGRRQTADAAHARVLVPASGRTSPFDPAHSGILVAPDAAGGNEPATSTIEAVPPAAPAPVPRAATATPATPPPATTGDR